MNKFKKAGILAGLGLLTTFSVSTAAYGNPVTDDLVQGNVTRSGFSIGFNALPDGTPLEKAGTLKIISDVTSIAGTVKEIDDNFMKIEDEQGKVFTVPLYRFSQLEEFKDLNLQVGDTVTVDGFGNGKPASIAISAVPFAGEINLKEINPEDLPQIDREAVQITVQAVPAAGLTWSFKGGEGEAAMLEPIDPEAIKINPEELKLNAENATLITSSTLPAAGGFFLEEGEVLENVFIAQSITVGEKTVKLEDTFKTMASPVFQIKE